MIIQTCSAGTTVEGTVCVSAKNGCNVRSEEGQVPYCTHSAATVIAVTAKSVQGNSQVPLGIPTSAVQ